MLAEIPPGSNHTNTPTKTVLTLTTTMSPCLKRTNTRLTLMSQRKSTRKRHLNNTLRIVFMTLIATMIFMMLLRS